MYRMLIVLRAEGTGVLLMLFTFVECKQLNFTLLVKASDRLVRPTILGNPLFYILSCVLF
jgi:hypothetical protein